MQVKEIENWNKLNAKKLTIVGCDFYYTEAKVVDKNIYTVNLIEQISKDVYFRIDLFLDTMDIGIKVYFPNSMQTTPKHLQSKVTREDITNPERFSLVVVDTCLKDSLTFSLLELLSEIQSNVKHSKSNSGSVLGANLTSQGIISSSVMW
jgi:hypothetical protein